jgi:hypothetical protein
MPIYFTTWVVTIKLQGVTSIFVRRVFYVIYLNYKKKFSLAGKIQYIV